MFRHLMKSVVFSLLIGLVLQPAMGQKTTFPLSSQTGPSNPLDLGAFPGGALLKLKMAGTISLLGGPDFFTLPDGSLTQPVYHNNYLYANPGSTDYPNQDGGDGINHYPGGGMNYSEIGAIYAFAGKQTTDTTDPATIRFGAVVGTFSSNPQQTDWFYVGRGTIVIVPSDGAHLYLAVNEAENGYADNTGYYLGALQMKRAIKTIEISPNVVTGGTSASGTITLARAAPQGSAVVTLSSSNPSVVQVPATVTIPQGKKSATFMVQTSGVSSTITVTISALYGGTAASATLTIQP